MRVNTPGTPSKNETGRVRAFKPRESPVIPEDRFTARSKEIPPIPPDMNFAFLLFPVTVSPKARRNSALALIKVIAVDIFFSFRFYNDRVSLLFCALFP